MEAYPVILGQVDGLLEELAEALATISDEKLDAVLRERVVAGFETSLKRLSKRSGELRACIMDQRAIDQCWRDLHALQAEARPVFDECLAFIEGAWARLHGLDRGVCSLTDSLLSDLSRISGVPWNRFTLPATSQFYRPTAAIIRIRYPDLSLWSMPLAAHEFGHYLGPELRLEQGGELSFPFQLLLKQADEARGPKAHATAWYHLQEYFADTFATYSVGPAYAASFLLSRNPLDAHVESDSHPTLAARAQGIFWLLDALDRRADSKLSPPFRDITSHLRALWRAGLEAAGQDSEPTPSQAALATDRVKELLDVLIEGTRPGLPFSSSDWRRAQGVRNDLATARPPEGLTRRDVLNAVWLRRLEQGQNDPRSIRQLERDGFALYRKLGICQDAPSPV